MSKNWSMTIFAAGIGAGIGLIVGQILYIIFSLGDL